MKLFRLSRIKKAIKRGFIKIQKPRRNPKMEYIMKLKKEFEQDIKRG